MSVSFLLMASSAAFAADAISVETVSRLSSVATLRIGSAGAQPGKPALAGHMMFVLTPFPHTLIALDVSQPTPAVKWRYAPEPDGTVVEGLSRDGKGGEPIVVDSRVIFTTLDGRVIALSAEAGMVLWNVRVANPGRGEVLTGTPVVAGGVVIVGSGGDNNGARGWIAALDGASGHELWRRYSTGPDADVGIGPAFKPRYVDARGADRGVATWSPDQWKRGGGSVPGAVLFDPATRTLFHGTGHPAPWNPDQHPGDNLWTSGVFARDIATGDARWFTAINPHDLFALGSAPTGLLVERLRQGQQRKLLIHPDPNGYMYVLDAESGEILSATSYARNNVIERVDLATGRPLMRSERASRMNTMTRDVCPGRPGALSGTPTLGRGGNILLIPVSRLCMDFEARNTSYIPGTAYIGANVRLKAPADGMRGALLAWDIDAGRPAWTMPERFPVAGGVLVTGGVAIYGTLEGSLKALDAGTGRLLWQAETSAGIVGTPILYRDEDGRERIIVMSGLSGPFGTVAGPEIDVRDATAAQGMANALSSLPKPVDASGTLNVFALP